MEDALQGGPRPPKNEVWVYGTDGACTGGGDSFTQNYYEAGSRVTWAAIICLSSSLGPLRRPARDYEAAHEMGHALGFQDLVHSLNILVYMMRPDSFHCSLSLYEFAAVEVAYAAGLRPGDSRKTSSTPGSSSPDAQPNVSPDPMEVSNGRHSCVARGQPRTQPGLVAPQPRRPGVARYSVVKEPLAATMPRPEIGVLGPRGVAGTPSVEARSPAERRPLTRLQAGR